MLIIFALVVLGIAAILLFGAFNEGNGWIGLIGAILVYGGLKVLTA